MKRLQELLEAARLAKEHTEKKLEQCQGQKRDPALLQQLHLANTQVAELESKLKDCTRKLNELIERERADDTRQQLTRCREEKADLDKQLKDARNRFQERIKEAVEPLLADKRKLQQRIVVLLMQKKVLEKKLGELQTLLTAEQEKAAKLEAQLKSTEPPAASSAPEIQPLKDSLRASLAEQRRLGEEIDRLKNALAPAPPLVNVDTIAAVQGELRRCRADQKKLTKEYQKLKTSNENVLKNLQKLAQKHKDCNSNLASVGAALLSAQQQVTQVESENKALQNQSTVCQQQLAAAEREKEKTETEIIQLKRLKDSLIAKLKSVTNQRDGLVAVSVTLKKRLEKLAATLQQSPDAASVANELRTLTADKTQLQGEKAALEKARRQCDTDLASAQAQIQVLSDELKGAEQQFEAKKGEYASLQAQYTTLQSEYQKLRSEKASVDAELASAAAKVKKLEGEKDTLEARIQSLQTQNASLTRSASSEQTALASLEGQLAALESEKTLLKNQNQALASQLANERSTNTSLNTQLSAAQSRLQSVEEDLKNERLRFTAEEARLKGRPTEESYNQLLAELQALRTEKTVNDKRILTLQQQIVSLTEQVKEAPTRKQLEDAADQGRRDAAQIASLQQQLQASPDRQQVAAMQTENGRLTGLLVQAQQAFNADRATIASLQQQLAALTVTNSQLEARIRELTDQLRQALNEKSQAKASLAQCLKEKQSNDQEVAALNQRVRSLEGSLQAKDSLVEQANRERDNFKSLYEQQNQIRLSLVEDVMERDNENTKLSESLRTLEKGKNADIAALQKQLSELQTQAAVVPTYETRIRQLEADLVTSQSENAQIASNIGYYQNELAKCNANLNAVTSTGSGQLQQLAAQLSEANTKLAQALKSLQSVTAERDQYLREGRKLEGDAQNAIATLKGEIQRRENAANQAEAGRVKAVGERDAFVSRLQQSEQQRVALVNENMTLQQTLARLKAAADAAVDQLKDQIRNLQSQTPDAQLAAQLNAANATIASLNQQNMMLSASQSSTSQQMYAAAVQQAELNLRQQLEDQLRLVRDTASGELAARDATIVSLQQQLHALKNAEQRLSAAENDLIFARQENGRLKNQDAVRTQVESDLRDEIKSLQQLVKGTKLEVVDRENIIASKDGKLFALQQKLDQALAALGVAGAPVTAPPPPVIQIIREQTTTHTDTEYNNALTEIARLQSLLDAEKRKTAKLKSENDVLSSAVDYTDAQLEASNEARNNLLGQLSAEAQKLQQLEARYRGLQAQTGAATRSEAALQQQLQIVSGERDRYYSDLQDANAQNSVLANKVQSKQNTIDTLKILPRKIAVLESNARNDQQTIQQLNAQIAALQEEVRNTQQNLQESIGEKNSLEANIILLEKRISELEELLRQLNVPVQPVQQVISLTVTGAKPKYPPADKRFQRDKWNDLYCDKFNKEYCEYRSDDKNGLCVYNSRSQKCKAIPRDTFQLFTQPALDSMFAKIRQVDSSDSVLQNIVDTSEPPYLRAGEVAAKKKEYKARAKELRQQLLTGGMSAKRYARKLTKLQTKYHV